MVPMRTFRFAAALAGAAFLAGCAATGQPADDPYAPNDPLEEVNRAVFDFNLAVDDYVLVPTAKTYRTVVPELGREAVQNFFANLRSPITFFNDVLQGERERAGQTFTRIWLNTTIGLGGLLDVATYFGVPAHTEDFGQTFAVWGVPDGPYLMLPLLGPSNLRDTGGVAAGFFADPFNIWMGNIDFDWVPYARSASEAVDARSRNIETFEKLRETSLDYYATIRSLYGQKRQSDIRNEDSPAPTASPISSERPATE
jgi:phospholipid-binding lipoprotein MlaA